METYLQNNRVLGLFKFGKRDHIEKFVREGYLFMQTLAYFRKLEATDLLRLDKHEGADYCLQVDRAKLRAEYDEKWVDIGVIHDQLVFSDESVELTNVFCMYAFRESAIGSLVDPRNFDFGERFVVLTDGNEFLRRVHIAATRDKVTLKQGLVEYVDRTIHNGPMGAFRKFSDFTYQSEFRIAVVSGTKKPYPLIVGDLSDIAIVGNSSDLNKRIKIELLSNKNSILQCYE